MLYYNKTIFMVLAKVRKYDQFMIKELNQVTYIPWNLADKPIIMSSANRACV